MRTTFAEKVAFVIINQLIGMVIAAAMFGGSTYDRGRRSGILEGRRQLTQCDTGEAVVHDGKIVCATEAEEQ